MAPKCAGCVHVHYPKDNSIACLANNFLEEQHGFEDNPPEVGNVGKVDYQAGGLWDAIVVGVYAGKQGKAVAEEVWNDVKQRQKMTEVGRTFADQHNITLDVPEVDATLNTTLTVSAETSALRKDVDWLLEHVGSFKRLLKETNDDVKELKKRCLDLEVIQGNKVLDGSELDKLADRMKVYEDGLKVVDDLKKKVETGSSVRPNPGMMSHVDQVAYYFDKLDTENPQSWRDAVQKLVLSMFDKDTLLVSCPTVSGAKSSPTNRIGLDPVKLDVVYEVLKGLCAKRTQLDKKLWQMPRWAEINIKLGQMLKHQRDIQALKDKETNNNSLAGI